MIFALGLVAQTLLEIGGDDEGSAIVFPLPIDLGKPPLGALHEVG
jgi:hypothetical protein